MQHYKQGRMTHQHSSLAEIYLNPSAGPFQEGILGSVGRGALQMGKEMIVSQLAGAVASFLLATVVGGVMGRKKGQMTDSDIDRGIDDQIARLPVTQQQAIRGDRARIRAEVKNQLQRRGKRESLVDIYRESDSFKTANDALKPGTPINDLAKGKLGWATVEKAAKALESIGVPITLSSVKEMISRPKISGKTLQDAIEDAKRMGVDPKSISSNPEDWIAVQQEGSGFGTTRSSNGRRVSGAAKDQVEKSSLFYQKREAEYLWDKLLTPEETQALSAAQRKSYQKWLGGPVGKKLMDESLKVASAADNQAMLAAKSQLSTQIDDRLKAIESRLKVSDSSKAGPEELVSLKNERNYLKEQAKSLKGVRTLEELGAKATAVGNNLAKYNGEQSAALIAHKASIPKDPTLGGAIKPEVVHSKPASSRGHLSAVPDPINPAKASNPALAAASVEKKAAQKAASGGSHSLADIYANALKNTAKATPKPAGTMKPPTPPPTPARPLSGALQRLKNIGNKAAHEVEEFVAYHPSKAILGGIAVGAVIGALGAKVISILSTHPAGMSDGDLMHNIDNNLESYLRGMPGEQAVIARARVDQKFRSHLVQEVFAGARKKVPRPGEKTVVGRAVDQAKSSAGKFAKKSASSLAGAAAVYGTSVAVEKLTGGWVPRNTTASIISGGSVRFGPKETAKNADIAGQDITKMSDRDLRKHLRNKLDLNTEAETKRREKRAAKDAIKDYINGREGDILPINHPKVAALIQRHMKENYASMSKHAQAAFKQRMADPVLRKQEEQKVYETIKAVSPKLLMEKDK